MDDNIVMKNPLCIIWKTTFQRMEYLNTHMKVKHDESDSTRIDRLTKTVELSLLNEGKDKQININESKLKSLDCTECGVLFVNIKEQKDHNVKHHVNGASYNEDNEYLEFEDGNNDLSINSEYYEIREFPDNKTTENMELDKVFGKKAKIYQQGITMKSKSQAFKDASTAIKSKITKGKILKDEKGRQVTILDELPNGAYEVEVQTLSKKGNEKRGRAKLHMYRPEPSKKKVCTILISKSGGYDIVFVKVLMEMFIKPMIDQIINDPGKDPMMQYTTKHHDKTIGKAKVTVKEDDDKIEAKCRNCDKVCLNDKGLRIHMGKLHTAKRKREEEKCSESDECETCGYTCDTVIALEWHKKKCARGREEFHASRKLTPANKKDMRKASISPENTKSVPLSNKMDEDNKNKCDDCEFENSNEYVLMQHKRDHHKNTSVSVTPPPKKQKENEFNMEADIEIIVKQIYELKVDNEKQVHYREKEDKSVPKEEEYI